jgi:hypothetical protein
MPLLASPPSRPRGASRRGGGAGGCSPGCFDHAFQIVVIAVLAMIVCVPFFRVPGGARGARMH